MATPHEDLVRAFVDQLLRTGLLLTDTIAGLFDDLPDDAFDGEDHGRVLLEMLTGTIRPAAIAAGTETLEGATALLGAVFDRAEADLRAALELASRRE
jgi:hypothetical protein